MFLGRSGDNNCAPRRWITFDGSIRIAGIEGRIRDQPDAGHLAAPSRDRVIKTIASIEIEDVRRPKRAGKPRHGIGGPVGRLGKNTGATAPKDFVSGPLRGDSLAGIEQVILVLALDDGAGIVGG